MNDKVGLATLFGLAILGVHYHNDWVLILVLIATLCWAVWIACTFLWDNRKRFIRYLPHAAVTLLLQGAFCIDRVGGALMCGLFIVSAVFIIFHAHVHHTNTREVLKVSTRVSTLIGWNMLVGLLWTTIKLSV